MTQATVIVQARMGSTRLPGKVLKPIGGRPMFSYQIERLRAAQRVERIVVATTTEPADAAIVDFCAAEQVPCVRGSEMDVLSRYALAAAEFDARTVVRVTSDCPLIDPQLVDEAIQAFTGASGEYHYVSNMLRPTWPYGMAVEVFSRELLDVAHREATKPAEREHVTPFIYWRPERYRLKSLERQPDLSQHRWTVDTPEDFELISRILGALHPNHPRFTLQDVLALLDRHPAWVEINRHVQQKAVSANP
jgi:spore coat polysaccharide biosynthesis protein SpsF